MNQADHIDLDSLDVSEGWHQSVTDDLQKSNNRAWIVAAVVAAIALLEAIALVYLIPLKTVEPYTLLVDRQTGNVEALAPLDAQTVAPDAALTKSFLVQYVIARESFDSAGVQDNYRKVSLWTEGAARQRYARMMDANNPESPLAFMPNGGILRTEVRSISSLAAGRSLVRFTTTRNERGGRAQSPEYWAAVVDYTFTNAEMSEADRLVNPLGFQVTRYRRNAETLPEVVEAQIPARRAAQPVRAAE